MRQTIDQAKITFNQEADIDAITEYFRAHLKQVVTLHMAMFEKLLFESDDIPVELAELFEDAGNTYIDISETISRQLFLNRFLKIKKKLDPNVETAGRVVKAKIRAEPRVRRPKHLA